MSVHLHIERLLLDGFEMTSKHRVHLQDAMEQELVRLLTAPNALRRKSSQADDLHRESRSGSTHSLADQGGAVASLTAGPFRPPHLATPTQLGQHIAQAVHGALGTRNKSGR